MKKIKLQHRTYFGKDRKTKYFQHRINIPHQIIKKLDWTQEDQIILKVDSKKNGITLKLKSITNDDNQVI